VSAGRRRALVLALVLGALAGGELAVRLLAGRLVWRPLPPFGRGAIQSAWLARTERELAEGLPPPGYSTFDAELGWTTRPGYAAPAGDIHINARGLRALREYPEAPPPGVRRVLAFGESFTFGEEVEDAECWTARLEALDPSLEVLNYGVGGYGTDQALLRARREARGPAAWCLVGFMTENIGRNVNRYRPLWYPSAQPAAKPRFVLASRAGGSHVRTDVPALELVPQPFPSLAEFVTAVRSGAVFERLAEHEHWRASPVPEWMLGSMVVRLLASQRAYAERELAPLYADPEGEPLRTTVALLEAFRPLAAALGGGEDEEPGENPDGARLLVLVFPMRGDLEHLVAGDARTWTPLLVALDAAGIPWLDLSVPLVEEARAHGVASLFAASHLGPHANDLVARAVLARLSGTEDGERPR